MSDPNAFLSGEDRVKVESLKRARESHLNVYLTLTSIVQGAVLAYLLSFVSVRAGNLGIVGWILTSATFLLVVVTWNEYVMGVITFRWVPDLVDSAIPFLFGVAEYVLINRISDDLTRWVYGFVAFSVVSLVAFRNMYSKAKREDGHNEIVLAALGRFVQVNSMLPAFGVLLSIMFIAIDVLVGSCVSLMVVAAIVIVLCCVGYTLRTWFYWRRFVAFARNVDNQLQLPFLPLAPLPPERDEADMKIK